MLKIVGELTIGEDFLARCTLEVVFAIFEGLIEGDEMHGESKDENGQDSEKASEIFHQVSNDNGPRSEEMMERQEVENLDAGEKETQSEKLVPEVD